jgi:hypothetical protein
VNVVTRCEERASKEDSSSSRFLDARVLDFFLALVLVSDM